MSQPSSKHRATAKGSTVPTQSGGSARVRRINVRALFVLGLVLLIGIPGFFGVKLVQDSRRRAALLTQAHRQLEAERPDMALRSVNAYLEYDPNDPEALDLKARLLAEAARSREHVVQAIQANERAVRLDPEAPGRLDTRRRLVELYLRMERFVHPSEVRYLTASRVAAELIARARATPEGPRAEDYLLQARALEGLASSSTSELETLHEAAQSFEQALVLEPGNVEAVERLARLDRDRLDQPEQADQLFEDLLRDHPSVEASLAAFRHFAASSPERAEAALASALAEAPEDPRVRLAAAEQAWQRGARDAARAHLDALPESHHASLQARTLRGLIELQDNNLDYAIDQWRAGLLQAGGADADLSWWLALVLLQLGRIDEADPLIEQFRRLAGQDEPTPEYLLLRALRDLKTHRAAVAIDTLERARVPSQIARPLRAQAYFTLGQAQEAVHQPHAAADAYRRAAQLAPTWNTPRLALVGLLRADGPDPAIAELTRALRDHPDDPALLLATADLLWRQQLQRPEAQRSWDEVERLFERARRLAPDHPQVVVAWANFLAATGQLDQAVEQLEHALEAEAGGARRSPTVWTALAAGRARQGRLGDALSLLDRALQPDAAGDDASLRILRARLLTQKGHGRAARAQLIENLDRLPTAQRPLVWEALSHLQLAQGDTPAARSAVEQWARLAPNNPRPRLLLLDFALADGDEAAIAAQVQALQSDAIGGQRNLYWKVGRVHQLLAQLRRDPPSPNDSQALLDEADQLIADIRQLAPDQPAADLLLGLLLEHQGQPEPAIDAYEAALQHGATRAALARLRVLLTRLDRPEDLARYQALAAAALEQNSPIEFLARAPQLLGDPAAARAAADEFLRGNPESLQAHVLAARLLHSAGDPDAAVRTLRALIDRQPRELGPWLALLSFHAQRGDLDAADRTLDQLTSSVPSEHPELLLAQCQRLLGRLDRAETLFDAALDRYPDDPTVLQAAADYFETTSRPDRAEDLLRRLRDLDPSSDWAARRLALLLSNRRNAPDAWSEAQELVDQQLDADSPNNRLARGIVYARASDAEQQQKGVEQLEELVADLPATDAVAQAARSVLVELLLVLGRPDAANMHAQRLTANLPAANPNAIALHIETLLRANRLDEADAQIEQLARREPDSLRLAQLRARLLLARSPENRAQAAEILEAAAQNRLQALADEPSSTERVDSQARRRDEELLQLIRLLAGWTGSLDAAARIADALAEHRPDTAWLLAEIQIARRDLDQAIEALRRTLGSEVDIEQLVPGFEKLIVLADDLDRLDDAEALVGELRRQRPEQPEPLQLLALLRHLQGNYDAEVALYEQISQLAPDDFRHLNNLAWTLSEELEQPEQALPTVERALEKAPASARPSILDTKGVILTRLGKLEEAIAAFEQSLSDRPAGVTYFHLARALQQQGQAQAAETALNQARDAGLDPRQLSHRDRAEWEALNEPDN